MAKIKCPHCGYWQESYPHVILCEKCYANIKDVIEEHLKGKVGEDPPKELKSHFLEWGWNAFIKPSTEAPWRLSGPLVILKRTFETSFKRFSTLYPLIFLSFLFFMLIGIFTSRIGAHIVYKMSEVSPYVVSLILFQNRRRKTEGEKRNPRETVGGVSARLLSKQEAIQRRLPWWAAVY